MLSEHGTCVAGPFHLYPGRRDACKGGDEDNSKVGCSCSCTASGITLPQIQGARRHLLRRGFVKTLQTLQLISATMDAGQGPDHLDICCMLVPLPTHQQKKGTPPSTSQQLVCIYKIASTTINGCIDIGIGPLVPDCRCSTSPALTRPPFCDMHDSSRSAPRASSIPITVPPPDRTKSCPGWWPTCSPSVLEKDAEDLKPGAVEISRALCTIDQAHTTSYTVKFGQRHLERHGESGAKRTGICALHSVQPKHTTRPQTCLLALTAVMRTRNC